MKKKSITELKDEKAQLSTRSKAIIDAAKAEKRMFNEGENEELASIQARMAEINVEIEEVMEENRQEPTKKINNKMEEFSLRKAILAHLNGKSQGVAEQGVINEAMELNQRCGVGDSTTNSLVLPISYRAVTAGGTIGILVDEEKQETLFPLENYLVLTQAGARYMTGLKGNISWPKTDRKSVV